MGIRVQIAGLMVAVVAPLLVLATSSSYALFSAQRELHSQRHLERVRALRLALDTELRATERMLLAFADLEVLSGAALPAPDVLHDAVQRLLTRHPTWSSLAVVEPDGRVSAALHRHGSGLPALDDSTRERLLATREPAVSDLVASTDGAAHLVFVAVPVLAAGTVLRAVAAGIDHPQWLAFLQRFPVAEDATLTLSDSRGLIIARTLNNERWVGSPSRADFRQRVAAGPREDAFVTPGLEGQTFYTAYSRLEATPWTLATGVPEARVEAALQRQTALLAGGAALAVMLAAAGAWLLGRRITGALTRLAEVSRGGDTGEGEPLVIEEAETARLQLRDTLRSQTRARAEAEVARAQAEAANRGKDEFVAMVAHELRNPLSTMGTAVALLEATDGATPAQRQAQQVLKRQVHQMSRLIEDLLDAARADRGKLVLQLEDVDLAAVVPSVLEAFSDAGRTRHLQVSLALEPAVVRADPVRLEQIVANLIDNAAKFTGRSGRVEVRLRCLEGQALLSVQDDGVGVSPELLPHLFDPYTQADPGGCARRAGLGLGLHVVQRLVAAHGGSIEAHSAGVGQGSCFTVRLPLAAQRQAHGGAVGRAS